MGRSSSIPNGLPVGSVVQGINLSGPEYVPCDGRPGAGQLCAAGRAFPFGKLTGTVRALVESSSSYCIAASPTYLVAAAASGSSAVQYSTDGVTWSKAGVATPNTSGQQSDLCWHSLDCHKQPWLGPFVTSGDNPGSTWTELTGGTPVPWCGTGWRTARRWAVPHSLPKAPIPQSTPSKTAPPRWWPARPARRRALASAGAARSSSPSTGPRSPHPPTALPGPMRRCPKGLQALQASPATALGRS